MKEKLQHFRLLYVHRSFHWSALLCGLSTLDISTIQLTVAHGSRYIDIFIIIQVAARLCIRSHLSICLFVIRQLLTVLTQKVYFWCSFSEATCTVCVSLMSRSGQGHVVVSVVCLSLTKASIKNPSYQLLLKLLFKFLPEQLLYRCFAALFHGHHDVRTRPTTTMTTTARATTTL